MWPFSTLLHSKSSFGAVVLTGWAAATIPAILLVALAQQVLPPEMFDAVEDALFPAESPLLLDGFSIVVVAPMLETLVMALIFFISRSIGFGPVGQVIIQVLFWAAAHGAFALAWAIGPAWIFFILSIIWVGQRDASFSKAYWTVAMVHALNNLLAFGGVAAERLGWVEGVS